MTPERWQQVKDILAGALDVAQKDRPAYLDQRCGGDVGLRADVEQLLQDERAMSGFLAQSSWVAAALVGEKPIPWSGRRVGSYEILEQIGAGGMGEVYRAHDSRLGRDVAVKILPLEFSVDPERLRRFEQEARSAAALNHPNILAIYDVGTESGTPYIISELLTGETLRTRLKSGPVPVSKAMDYAVQMAQGLAAAHERGIVHRDLKPDNLFVTREGRVKILDFGLAKLTHNQNNFRNSALTIAEPTQSGLVMGTVGYMAPEQVRGESVDHRADIFAFGAVLYEILTGKRAFQKPTSAETMTAILHEDPPRISQITPGLPPALERAAQRCLEKSPEQRFQSASDLAFALDTLSDSASPLTGARAAPGSVAVLPFENVGAQPELDYLSDGITEVLISSLSRKPGLKVVARSSVFHFKGRTGDAISIGRQLGVSSVVTGRVLQHGNSIRVGVELVDVRDGWQLWGEQYRRGVDEILFVEDEIPKEIVAHLQRELTTDTEKGPRRAQTANLEAFHLYLKGRHYWNKRTEGALQKAISLFKEAIEADPVYGLAHAALADCYMPLGYWTYLSPENAFPKAKAAAERALQVDPTIAEAYTVLSGVNMCFDWRIQECEITLKRALDLNPNSPRAHQVYAELLALTGEFGKASSEAKCAIELDPLAPAAYFAAGLVMYCAREYAQARDECKKALDMDPDFFPAHLVAGLVLEREGRFADAMESLENAYKASRGNILIRAVLSGTFAFAGRPDDARAVLRELEQCSAEKYVSPVPIAVTLAALGEYEAAFARLEDSVRLRCPRTIWCKVDPRFDILRSDPRYAGFLRRVGLMQ